MYPFLCPNNLCMLIWLFSENQRNLYNLQATRNIINREHTADCSNAEAHVLNLQCLVGDMIYRIRKSPLRCANFHRQVKNSKKAWPGREHDYS